MEIGLLLWRRHNLDKLAEHGISRLDVEDLVALDDWVTYVHPDYPDQVRGREAVPQGRAPMSATTDQIPQVHERVPEPPLPDEDRRRWRSVGRGRGVPRARPLVGVEVLFDREQSDWLGREAERTGLDYVQLLKKLVDDARAREPR